MQTKKSRCLAGLLVLAVLLSLLPVLVAPQTAAAAATTSVTINKYDAHGSLIGTRTVDWEWMMNNLQVYGDGTRHYYMHGPTFDESGYDLLWDTVELVNIDTRDYGAAMGTDVKDLCNLVGGATAGDTIQIKAADNFSKWFDYEDVYSPEPEQGRMIVTWYTRDNADGLSGYVSSGSSGTYPTGYTTGMRLVFFAQTTNSEGKYVFGDWDMHNTLPASRWHYFYDGSYWPSSSGLSVQVVSRINIYEPGLISCDASGNEKDNFAPGETVHVKGAGLTASRSYKLWIQGEPVLLSPLNALDRPEGTCTLTSGNDPSGARESVTTNASGDFGPVAIWSIPVSAGVQKYDIVADNQGSGTVGTYDTSDRVDNPGWQGFRVTEPSSTITASAGSNGSISPSGSVSVAYGASQTFAITASTGYHVADVLVDGSSVGAVTSYTFTGVTADHTISATFAVNAGAPDWDPSGDGVCNINDVVVIGLKWGQTGADGWIPEDVNSDGVININDVVVIGLHWGETW